jgi:hypothetical protein
LIGSGRHFQPARLGIGSVVLVSASFPGSSYFGPGEEFPETTENFWLDYGNEI